MIWFDIKQLEKNLKADAVSERETFTYLLVLLLISTISSYVNEPEVPLQLINWIELALDVVLTVLTLKTTYDINTKGDNRDYVKDLWHLPGYDDQTNCFCCTGCSCRISHH